VAEMPPASMRPFLVRANTISRRCGKAETSCGHGFPRCFESDNRKTIGEGNKTARRTAQRVPNQPDIGIWVDGRYISIYLLSGVIIAILVL
jgi:hypothetical protein